MPGLNRHKIRNFDTIWWCGFTHLGLSTHFHWLAMRDVCRVQARHFVNTLYGPNPAVVLERRPGYNDSQVTGAALSFKERTSSLGSRANDERLRRPPERRRLAAGFVSRAVIHILKAVVRAAVRRIPCGLMVAVSSNGRRDFCAKCVSDAKVLRIEKKRVAKTLSRIIETWTAWFRCGGLCAILRRCQVGKRETTFVDHSARRMRRDWQKHDSVHVRERHHRRRCRT